MYHSAPICETPRRGSSDCGLRIAMLSHRATAATEQKEKSGFLGNIFSSPALWLCGSVANRNPQSAIRNQKILDPRSYYVTIRGVMRILASRFRAHTRQVFFWLTVCAVAGVAMLFLFDDSCQQDGGQHYLFAR